MIYKYFNTFFFFIYQRYYQGSKVGENFFLDNWRKEKELMMICSRYNKRKLDIDCFFRNNFFHLFSFSPIFDNFKSSWNWLYNSKDRNTNRINFFSRFFKDTTKSKMAVHILFMIFQGKNDKKRVSWRCENTYTRLFLWGSPIKPCLLLLLGLL